MLGRCRLKKEEALLAARSECNTISTKEFTSNAVGPTLIFPLHIEGVQVEAMVDTGSQSTIISRAVLHKVGKNRPFQCKEKYAMNAIMSTQLPVTS